MKAFATGLFLALVAAAAIAEMPEEHFSNRTLYASGSTTSGYNVGVYATVMDGTSQYYQMSGSLQVTVYDSSWNLLVSYANWNLPVFPITLAGNKMSFEKEFDATYGTIAGTWKVQLECDFRSPDGYFSKQEVNTVIRGSSQFGGPDANGHQTNYTLGGPCHIALVGPGMTIELDVYGYGYVTDAVVQRHVK